MSLEEFEIKALSGRVCYMRQKPEGCSVTMECYAKKLAFQFVTKKPFSIGDWVELTGTAKFKPGKRKDGVPYDSNLEYFHDPMDGSPRKDWVFFSPTKSSVKVRRLKAREVGRILQARLRRHQNSPEKNETCKKWAETARLMDLVCEYVHKHASKDMASAIVTPSIRAV